MKKYLLLLAAMFLATAGFAQKAAILNRIDSKEDFEKKSHDVKERFINKKSSDIIQYRDSEIESTTILKEDFSKFTEGSEDFPDETPLDDIETAVIDDAYFNTPGWYGYEVYQAGGCAFLDVDPSGETGMLITPYINTSGNVTIQCRVKSVSPDGEYMCYNIANDYDALDLDYKYIPGQEWVDVEFASSYGADNSYVILFGLYDAIFIDDIKIVSHYIPTPTILPETNVTSTGFTANWEAVNGVDDYYFYLNAVHTAQYDETYFFVNYDFSDVISNGSEIDPEIPEDLSYEYGAWYLFLPVYINNAIGLSGEFSGMEYYGYMSSPQYDLSSNYGKFNVSLKLKGKTDDLVEVHAIDSSGELADGEYFALGNDEWTEYTFNFEGGDEKTLIEIIYFGDDYLFIDDLRIFQDLTTGAKVTTPLIQKLCYGATSINVTVPESNRLDELFYQIYCLKYIYTYEDGEYYVSSAMVSDMTDPRFVVLSTDNPDGINDMVAESPAFARFNEGQLNIYNPNNEMVSVYNITGSCIYSASVNGAVNLNLAKGSYIVKIGNKVIKAVN